MGVESKRSAPPLPAPTDTDTASGLGTELATEVSRATDRTSYSLPEDGTPLTISTRKKGEKGGEAGVSLTRQGHDSKTSLLIEYFEAGKNGKSESRRPSVRVKVTPSSKSRSRSANDHGSVQISESKGGRKTSHSKRIHLSSNDARAERDRDDDARSRTSYGSVTEESNLTSRSGGPIEIEVTPRRHGSPLIPANDERSFVQMGSDVSSMPANSFLDGKSRSPERKRSQSLSKGEILGAGAAAGLAAAAIADHLRTPSRRRSRSLSRERVVAQKVAEKVRGDKPERRHKHRESRSRSVSNSEKHGEVKSPRRRSSRSHNEESFISGTTGADSSLLSTSKVSDQRSFRSGTSKSSINNPKLLETVEDAIRRLILPELTALKKEQKANRDKYERRGSITPGSSALSGESREETTTRKVSGRSSSKDASSRRERELLDGGSGKVRKERRSERSLEESPRSSDRYASEDTIVRADEEHQKRNNKLEALAAGAGIGALTAAALHGHNSKEKLEESTRERRRRRKDHSRSDLTTESYEESTRHRMPMMSDINPSEITRASILSAETERPLSAADDEYRTTPIHEVPRGFASPASMTPTRTPIQQHSIGMHDNISRADITREPELLQEEYALDEHGRKVPMSQARGGDHMDEFEEGEEERVDQHPLQHGLEAAAIGGAAGAALGHMFHHHDNDRDIDENDEDLDEEYYQHDQSVPPPLRYVPYNQQKRGLSPIPQSVSSYRGEENRDSRTTRSMNSYSTLNRSPEHKASAMSMGSSRNEHDFPDVRQGGLTESELTQEGDQSYWDRENERDRNIDGGDSYVGTDSAVGYRRDRDTVYTEDSEYPDRVSAGQNVKGIGALPGYVHTPHGAESAVASLMSASVVTGDSGNSGGLDRKLSYASYGDGSERDFMSRGNSPAKQDQSRNLGGYEDGFARKEGGFSSPLKHDQLSHGGSYEQIQARNVGVESPLKRDNLSHGASYEEVHNQNLVGEKTGNPAHGGSYEDISQHQYFDSPKRHDLHQMRSGEYVEDDQRYASRENSPSKLSNVRSQGFEDETRQLNSPGLAPEYPEYELDDQGRKVTMPDYKKSHRAAAESALAGVAVGAAAAALANRHHNQNQAGSVHSEGYQDHHENSRDIQQHHPESVHSEGYVDHEMTGTNYGHNNQPAYGSHMYDEPQVSETTGAPLQRSFKDRAMDTQISPSPKHSIDRLTEHDRLDSRNEGYNHQPEQEQVKMSASGIPDVHDPMPEIGYDLGTEDGSETGSVIRSVIHGPIGGAEHGNRDHWPNQPTPQTKSGFRDHSPAVHSDFGLRDAEMGLLGAAAGAGAAAAIASHNKATGHDHHEPDEQWQRTSEDRKRDTLITNPYEGTSPVALGAQGLPVDYNQEYGTHKNGLGGYATGSPMGMQKGVDEGYISSVPNGSGRSPIPEPRQKGVGFMDSVGLGAEGGAEDPFYQPNHARHLSGLADGMASPLYEGATGHGMDRIKSQDIVALMDHLTVRDAQRSARDTEILVTLVSAAAEMRNSFEDMKRLLADTEDVIITEVQRNTDKSVQKAINGPRPPPISARSARSQDEMIDDIPARRRNVFKRALKGLSMRSSNDLTKIEDMLVQLLGEVEGLKVAQGLPRSIGQSDAYDDQDQDGNYEQDHGYEPEGHAGTSTAGSHASQSGHFSAPQNRSATRLFDSRKFSDHRISTVPEGDEELEEHAPLTPHEQAILGNQFENNEDLLSPTRGMGDHEMRGGSVPLGTPPVHHVDKESYSNENTPKTGEKHKKHKSSSSSGWIPKISRWSETTASTVARGFRSSAKNSKKDTESYEQAQSPLSRSGSDLGQYADMQNHMHPYGDDKLHSGFSTDNVAYNSQAENTPPTQSQERSLNRRQVGSGSPQPRQLASLLPPEDPKYKAHRNSLNLQHPQPRQGPTGRYQTALESQAQDYGGMGGMGSPNSLDWGSSTSVNRLPANRNMRYSQQTNTTTSSGGIGMDMSAGVGRDSPISDRGGYGSPVTQGNTTLQLNTAPMRPPKEPLQPSQDSGPERPPKIRPNKLTKPSPLSNENLSTMEDQGRRFSDMSASNEARSQERMVGGNGMAFAQRAKGLGVPVGVPSRKPTGPRSMGSPRSGSGSVGMASPNGEDAGFVARNRNRDTFGTIASEESETF